MERIARSLVGIGKRIVSQSYNDEESCIDVFFARNASGRVALTSNRGSSRYGGDILIYTRYSIARKPVVIVRCESA